MSAVTKIIDPTSSPVLVVAKEAFRDAMSLFPGAVNIVTTDGPCGRAGFTATAVCSVTDSPPTLLVCINRSSSAAPVFTGNSTLCVNTVGASHQDIAALFGGKTPMEERFAAARWTTDKTGSPVLEGAAISFDCRISERQQIGTHDVLYCQIVSVSKNDGTTASIWLDRSFHKIAV